MTGEFITNHLWQSSCFVLLAGLLAMALRKSPAKVRYWVWLSASLKFLAPLALLMSVGSMIPRPAQRVPWATDPVPFIPNAIVQIAEPFTPTSYSAVPAHAPTHWLPVAIGIGWALGFLAIASVRWHSWLRIRAALRASHAHRTADSDSGVDRTRRDRAQASSVFCARFWFCRRACWTA